jgi:hypothetical protein
MKQKKCGGKCWWKALGSAIHPVDISLILFMLVLLGQSVYVLVSSGGSDQRVSDIDVVVRTAAAAVFGYFLSGNFMIRESSGREEPMKSVGHTIEVVGTTPNDAAQPQNRIGFAVEQSPALESGTAATQTPEEDVVPAGNCLQVAVATGIGLFCLVTLIVVRNTGALNEVENGSVTATIIQFRDFVSGCIGFLIGSPTERGSQSQAL